MGHRTIFRVNSAFMDHKHNQREGFNLSVQDSCHMLNP